MAMCLEARAPWDVIGRPKRMTDPRGSGAQAPLACGAQKP